LQSFISDFFQWKKGRREPPREVAHFDFTDIKPLADAEKTFYRVGVREEEARRVLDEQLASLREMARFAAAQICASVVGDARALTNRRFVAGLDLGRLRFDPEEIRESYRACAGSAEEYPWALDPHVLRRFVSGRQAAEMDEAELLTGVGGD